MNQIHFMGYDGTHAEDFIFDISKGYDCYLLLLTHTPAYFWVDGELKQYPAGHAILYPPEHKIYYTACHTPYTNDWIRFSSDEAFVLQFPVTGVPFQVSDMEYCHNLFQLLTWESAFISGNSELIITELLRVLFMKLYKDASHNVRHPHEQSLMSLRKNIHNRPQLPWSLQQMADDLHLSTGHLQLLYKKMFGTSCMDDVISARIRIAKDQLIYTSYSISKVAERCGYNNTEHFCRQFRQVTGISPGQYRKTAFIPSAHSSSSYRTVTILED